MSGNGSWRLGEVRGRFLEIECAACNRYGRLRVDHLLAGISLPDLKNRITQCANLDNPGTVTCYARFVRLG